jgi:hypothetical protein
MPLLAILVIGVTLITFLAVIIYVYFAYNSKNKSSKYLNIQKAFHDGYTAINFMKGLINNPDFIEQLNIDQINDLNIYLDIVRGGIAFKIRKTITNNVDRYLSEEQVYGASEKALYTCLIKNSLNNYKNNVNIKEKVIAFSKDYPKDLFDIYDCYYTKDLLHN